MKPVVLLDGAGKPSAPDPDAPLYKRIPLLDRLPDEASYLRTPEPLRFLYGAPFQDGSRVRAAVHEDAPDIEKLRHRVASGELVQLPSGATAESLAAEEAEREERQSIFKSELGKLEREAAEKRTAAAKARADQLVKRHEQEIERIRRSYGQ